MYMMEQIPAMMVRGNLKRGTTLCSFLVQNRKNVGIRFYQFTGYSRTKGVKMYSTFETKDYLFSSPKSRMSQGDLEKVYNDLQEFSKNGESTEKKTAVLQRSSQEVDLDQLIRNKKFFKINKV